MISNIIPTPKRVEIFEGMTDVPLSVCGDDHWSAYTQTLVEAFEKMFARSPKIGEGIRLSFDATLPANAYRMDSRDGIVLYASNEEGLYYAMASLLLAINARDGKFTLERALIEDYPDKSYRALLVDLARAWHPAHTVHQYIELCFILKIKYLHLHFVDDHGYTLPSRVLPHVTDGYRHYSFEDIEDMRAHAKKRGIVLIPEFEVPGHASILNENYPEIFSNTATAGENAYTVDGAVITCRSIICAGSERTFEAVKAMLAEVCELFPEAPYIHIGGDEANIKIWKGCPVCREYMEKHGLEDEYELYSEFVGRVADYVLSLGRTPIVWEGFPKKGIKYIPKETIVIAWESYYHTADDLLKEGFKVINSAWKPLYIVPNFDRRWGVPEILAWNVYSWQHFSAMSKAYLNPINVTPTENVLGAQLCAWESTFEQEIGRTTDCLFALSERTWTLERLHSDAEFAKRAGPTIWRVTRYIQEV